MKKTLKIFSLLLMIFAGLSLTACGDDDKDKDEFVPADQLPSVSQSFISTYYPEGKVVYVNRETEGNIIQYEVTMASGDEITFDSEGNWIDVDAPDGRSIPDGIAMQPIVDYVAANYVGAGINEIARTSTGFEVELTTGVDLRFGPDGTFYGQSY